MIVEWRRGADSHRKLGQPGPRPIKPSASLHSAENLQYICWIVKLNFAEGGKYEETPWGPYCDREGGPQREPSSLDVC